MLFPSTDPTPMFVMDVYTVPENNRSLELCVDAGVNVTQPETYTYTIATAQKFPPQAEGIYMHTCVHGHALEYNDTICCLNNCESHVL